MDKTEEILYYDELIDCIKKTIIQNIRNCKNTNESKEQDSQLRGQNKKLMKSLQLHIEYRKWITMEATKPEPIE